MYYGVYFPIVDVQNGGWGVIFGDEKGFYVGIIT